MHNLFGDEGAVISAKSGGKRPDGLAEEGIPGHKCGQGREREDDHSHVAVNEIMTSVIHLRGVVNLIPYNSSLTLYNDTYPHIGAISSSFWGLGLKLAINYGRLIVLTDEILWKLAKVLPQITNLSEFSRFVYHIYNLIEKNRKIAENYPALFWFFRSFKYIIYDDIPRSKNTSNPAIPPGFIVVVVVTVIE